MASLKRPSCSPVPQQRKRIRGRDSSVNELPSDVRGHSDVDQMPEYWATLHGYGYREMNLIGRGSHDVVKMASSAQDHLVAVKIVDRLASDPWYVNALLPTELELWPTLEHPNLLGLIEVFDDTRWVYMVTEYLDGGDLLLHLQSVGGALDIETARSWSFQISEALKYLHLKNIAHGDVKLENILIGRDNTVKLCDFGYIKDVRKNCVSVSYDGAIPYLPPEVILQTPHDPMAVDVWQLGCVMYILLCGRLPFDHEQEGIENQLMQQHDQTDVWKEPRCLKYRQCQRLLRQMLAFETTERPTITRVVQDAWFSKCRRQPAAPASCSRPSVPRSNPAGQLPPNLNNYAEPQPSLFDDGTSIGDISAASIGLPRASSSF